MDLLTVLVLVGLAGTLWSLGRGFASMAHGGDYDLAHGNDFMWRRVGWQGITIVLILFAMLSQVH